MTTIKVVTTGIGATTESGSIPGTTDSGSIPGTTDSGSIPGTTDSGSIPGTTDSGSIPGTTDSGSIPGTTDSGSIPGTTIMSGTIDSGVPAGTAPVFNTTLGLVSAPPIDNLRFAKPQPATQWNGTFNAVAYGPACPQHKNPFLDESLNEDCLSLNVFVPQVSNSDPLPIMVHIPGGRFTFYGSEVEPGENLAATGKVIVVSLNYRVGVFGFLNTNDDCARGNWGLWDQHLAIKWVKDNAERFGGDPNQITIFGKSSGANSVLYQALSPLNSNEDFKRVIAQSPIHFNYRSNDPYSGADLTRTLAKNLGYDNVKDSKGMLQYLRNQSVSDLLAEYANLPISFYPVMDDEFLRGTDLFDSDVDISQYDLLIGYNSGDMSASYGNRQPALNKQEFFDYIDTRLEGLCRDYDECQNKALAVQASAFAYNNIQDLNTNETLNIARAMEIALDTSFSSFVSFLARDHQARGGNTYAYEFTYADTEFWPVQAPPNILPRPGHVEDVYYVFGTDAISKGNADQRALSYAFMQYWTNFAING
ncbi:carboxylesterase 1C-like [Amphiura filiformis]|uniref:carboxylesterase 1C-like n=1 Tax=Amphiura filiformis TaxID=82378 RepID=UPI003B210DE6